MKKVKFNLAPGDRKHFDVLLRGLKVANKHTSDSIELRVAGCTDDDFECVDHERGRPIEAEYATLPNGTAAIVLPDQCKERPEYEDVTFICPRPRPPLEDFE